MKRRLHASGALGLAGSLILTLAALASTEDDSCLEEFRLVNHQQKSPTFEQPVKSSSYRDRATVVMLLSAG